MKRIYITIPKNGGPSRIEMEGYSGGSCKTRLDQLAATLGLAEGTEELKQEYYEAEASEGNYETE